MYLQVGINVDPYLFTQIYTKDETDKHVSMEALGGVSMSLHFVHLLALVPKFKAENNHSNKKKKRRKKTTEAVSSLVVLQRKICP